MKGKGVGKRPEAVTDERFAAVHRDPRFSRFPRKQAGVTIDERFKGAPIGLRRAWRRPGRSVAVARPSTPAWNRANGGRGLAGAAAAA